MKRLSVCLLLALWACGAASAQTATPSFATTTPPELEPVAAAQPLAPLPSPMQEPAASEQPASSLSPEEAKLNAANAINDRADVPSANGATPSNAQTPTSDSRSLARLSLQAIAGLLVVIALILLARAALTRWGSRQGFVAAPKLARPIGRLYLDKGVCLHLVAMGGRVLLIGATPQSVSLVAEFDEAAFDAENVTPSPSAAEAAASPTRSAPPRTRFADFLKSSARAMARPASPTSAPEEEDEIALLRTDIQRLQDYLRESPREPKD